jgi:hypothetical protein
VKFLLLLPFSVLLLAVAPPGQSAARPAYFRLSAPFRTDAYSIHDVSLLADSGGYVIVGYNESSATRRRSIGVAATNSAGKQLWSRTYGVKRAVRGLQAIRTADGGLLVWGNEADPARPHLLRISAKGKSLWSRTYGGHFCPGEYGHPTAAIARTSDSGFVMVGTLADPNGAPLYLLKTDLRGDTLWFRSLGTGCRPHSVLQTADGGYIVTGVAGGDVGIVKTDSKGNRLWSRSYGNPGAANYDQGWATQETRDGGFVVAGDLSCPRLPDDRYAMGPNYDAYLVRTDRSGESLWTRAYGGRRCQAGSWIRQAADGGFIMVGRDDQSTDGMVGPGDIRTYVVRTNANGDTLWTRSVGGTRNWGRWSVFKTVDDGLEIAALDAEDPFRDFQAGRPRKVSPDSISIRVISVGPTGKVSRPEYPDDIRDFQEGLAAARLDTKWGYVNEAAKFVLPPQFDDANHFSEGLAAVRVGTRWGFIGKNGRYVIQPQFDGIEEFTRGLAPAKSGGKWGYIDTTGSFVVPAKFDQVTCFACPLSQARIADTWVYINRTGDVVFRTAKDDVSFSKYGLTPAELGKKWGYKDSAGTFVIVPRFDKAYSFWMGLALVQADGEWGYIDRNGEYVWKEKSGRTRQAVAVERDDSTFLKPSASMDIGPRPDSGRATPSSSVAGGAQTTSAYLGNYSPMGKGYEWRYVTTEISLWSADNRKPARVETTADAYSTRLRCIGRLPLPDGRKAWALQRRVQYNAKTERTWSAKDTVTKIDTVYTDKVDSMNLYWSSRTSDQPSTEIMLPFRPSRVWRKKQTCDPTWSWAVRQESVSVPAGNYPRAWRVEDSTVIAGGKIMPARAQRWYVDGVGLVRTERQLIWGGRPRWLLIDELVFTKIGK